MSFNIADVIIVGAGIAGNSAAYYCSKKGLSVIVLEEEMIGHGGSSRNGGGARQSGRDIRELPLAMFAARNLWPNLSDELGIDTGYRQGGYLYCGYNEKDMEQMKERQRVASKAGLKVEVLKGREIQQFNPHVSDRVVCATWCETDGIASPLTAPLALYKGARERGVRFITGEKVTKINLIKGAARQVVTENGNIYEGGKIIIAAGYGGREIINTVGLDVPIFKRLVDVIVTESVPFMFSHMIGGANGYYGHQTDHGSFVFGNSTGRENCMAELKDMVSTEYNPSHICRTVAQDLPELADIKVIRTWSGWIDMCTDGVPIIGEVSEIPDLIIDIGATGHGFCPGPAVGYVMAELANGETPSVDISKLGYDRLDYSQKQQRYIG